LLVSRRAASHSPRVWHLALQANGTRCEGKSGRSSRPGQRPPKNRLDDRKAICSGKSQVDWIDAEVLAQFVEMMPPEPRPSPDATFRARSALVTRHHQLIEMMTA
jgi:hypothetical protein